MRRASRPARVAQGVTHYDSRSDRAFTSPLSCRTISVTDIAPEALEQIRARVAAAELRNVTILQAGARDTGLPTLTLGPVRSAPGADAVKVPHGPLDGMRFAGTIGPDGQPGRQDTLYFGDGQFWSEICIACGFRPGLYWVRFAEGAIHFRGEMESTDRGRFTYAGVVRDGHLIAHVNWRKHRWYWSINRDFVFRGTLAETVPATSAVSAARRATAADPQPGECDPGAAS